MKNKTIANWVIGAIALSVLSGILWNDDSVYTVAGLGFLVFGIVAVIIVAVICLYLYKLEDK